MRYISTESKSVRCISLWQPWASLVIHGHKNWETRGRKMIAPGRLLIHAAKTPKGYDLLYPSLFEKVHSYVEIGAKDYGAIIGEVVAGETLETIEALKKGLIDPKEKSLGNYYPGRYCTRLSSSVTYPVPIPYRGYQGIFYVPEEVIL